MTNINSEVNQTKSKRGTILVLMFDTPVPVDYGGVYDVMARLQVLKTMGYELQLLCTAREVDRLEYLASHRTQLVPALFSNIHVLQSGCFFSAASSFLPFSVSIRKVSLPASLLNEISHHQYDFVLVEHLKMAGLAQSLKPFLRCDFYLRMHNDESQFYLNLSRETNNLVKKIFFLIEGLKYHYYQRAILRGDMFSRVFFISSKDFVKIGAHCDERAFLLPIAFDLISAIEKRNLPKTIDFLYVGNLESDDNINALQLALEYLHIRGLQSACIMVCGRCRDVSRQQHIQKMVSSWPQLKLEFNVISERLASHYNTTKIFLNFSANSGGVKTKLVDAISHDLVILTNDAGVAGSGLDEFCIHVKEEDSAIKLRQLLESAEAYSEYLAARRARLNAFLAAVRQSYLSGFSNAKS